MGEVSVDLFVRSSLEHTDFFARLCEVDPAGRSVNVCDALLRLVPGRPAPEPDGTIRVRFALWPAAHRFRRGHRLRLQVSSGAHPRYARNTGHRRAAGHRDHAASPRTRRSITILIIRRRSCSRSPGPKDR